MSTDTNASYWESKGIIDNAYDALLQQIETDYSQQKKKLNGELSLELQGAYVDKMQSELNLPQYLAALGISGGMSDSASADLVNKYLSAREKANKQNSDKMSKLNQSYSSSKTDAEMKKMRELLKIVPRVSTSSPAKGVAGIADTAAPYTRKHSGTASSSYMPYMQFR